MVIDLSPSASPAANRGYSAHGETLNPCSCFQGFRVKEKKKRVQEWDEEDHQLSEIGQRLKVLE